MTPTASIRTSDGALRAVAAGLITPGAMKRAMIAAFGVATLLGVYLVAVGGWHGQRARVIRLLETSGIRPPAFGPRHASRSIAAI